MSIVSKLMKVEENVGEAPPKRKKRKLDLDNEIEEKVDHGEPFYPFRLVPSPQEARGLETSIICLVSFADLQWKFGLLRQ